MRFIGFLVFIGISVGLLGRPAIDLARTTPVPKDEPVPIADFFRPLQFQRPKLNPDGTLVGAYCSNDEERIDLQIIDVKTHAAQQLVMHHNDDVGTYDWLDEHHLIFSTVREKRYSFALYAADATNLGRRLAINAYDVVSIIGVPKQNPLQPLVWIKHSAAKHGADGGLVTFDTKSGVEMRIESNTDDEGRIISDEHNIVTRFPAPDGGPVVSYISDRNGELGFAVTVKDGVEVLHRWTGTAWEKCDLDLDTIDIITAGEKPGELLVIGPREEGKPRVLQRCDARTGALGEVVYQDKDYDVVPTRLHWRDSDRKFVGIDVSRDGPRSIWFEPGEDKVQSNLTEILKGAQPRIISADRTRQKLLVHAMSDRTPGRYYFVDTAKDEALVLGDAAPWIDSARMQPMHIMKYKSRDGVSIEAYLTLPAGASKEHPAPLVVLPHGGPWVRETWGWDSEAQFLANRGYAVFQPNYRGSPGYLWRFPKNTEWDFPGMSNDVTDGTRALIKAGLVDPQRIAIMGSSFGAYLALCGATNEPDLYRCAIGIAGVYDWEQMVSEAKADDYFPGRYGSLKRFLGDPHTAAAKYEAISPLRRAARIKIPIFVAHGRDDLVASVAQSKRLIQELEKYNVRHEVMLQGQEGHGFSRLNNEVELYSRIEAFLANELNPRAAGGGSGGR
jgi:dipeptidyl aminopeptidase/acylaminoacyl peptidase